MFNLSSILRALCFTAATLWAAPLWAAGDQPDPAIENKYFNATEAQGALYRDVANELRCPTCTGLSVLGSDASFSLQIRDLVRQQVEAGKSKGEILQYFTDRYGPWILRAPPKAGFDLIAWAIPISLLLLGPLVIWLFVWRKRRVVSLLGVRSAEEIITEMQLKLESLRQKRG